MKVGEYKGKVTTVNVKHLTDFYLTLSFTIPHGRIELATWDNFEGDSAVHVGRGGTNSDSNEDHT